MNIETSKSLEAMYRALIEAYGPLLRRDDVADALSTSPESLGNTMRRGREPNGLYMRRNKLRFGYPSIFPWPSGFRKCRKPGGKSPPR